ncbi:hypothetical protein MA16_Dca020713 [Dendrobium catenatum]|uniref:Endonuclease/exonuclease/phosphatase domain-containing protein n=1 Tax=Dendrobium catenatum TaxID=906689 RepID=A0A2I0WH10_9ASPA|nr:hypothetical protein MA16_Dca020713 [Dendrobium catenatum]
MTLWDQLNSFASNINGPWCVGGDFNIISNVSKRVGGNPPNTNAMDDFNTMINDCNLNDIGFFGSPFTWNRANLWQRLDRCLFNNEWIADFAMTNVEHLSRTLSDHSPILLKINKINISCSYAFRFQNMWMHHTDFKNIINVNWSAPVFPDNNVNGMLRLWAKLSRLKQCLRWWNKNIFKNIFSNIKDAEINVTDLDNIYLNNSDSDNLSCVNKAKENLFQLQLQ